MNPVGEAHVAVPPTVIRSMRTVGMPTPSSTFCPALPQTANPAFNARPLPINRSRLQRIYAPRVPRSDPFRLIPRMEKTET